MKCLTINCNNNILTHKYHDMKLLRSDDNSHRYLYLQIQQFSRNRYILLEGAIKVLWMGTYGVEKSVVRDRETILPVLLSLLTFGSI